MEVQKKSPGQKALFVCLVVAAIAILAHPLLVLLSLALVGMLVFAVFQAIFKKKMPEWSQIRAAGTNLGGAAWGACRWTSVQIDQHVYPAVMTGCSGIDKVGRHVCERIRVHARFVGTMLLEMICGGLVGALLGYLAGRPASNYEVTIPIACIGGAVLGLLVGLSRSPAAADSPFGQGGDVQF